MKINISTKEPGMKALPKGIFLARRDSPEGALTIIAPTSGMAGNYSAMDLEGRSGPAIGDVFSGYSAEDIREKFYPVDGAVTLQNEY